MKKTLLYLSLAALLLSACAREPKTGVNDAAKRYLDAWLQLNHPDAQQTPLGAFILSETPGSGVVVGSYEQNPFVRVRYTIAGLDGSIAYTTDEQLALQLGTYKEENFYGPIVWTRKDHALVAGLEEAISGMRVGGTRSVLLPGWLMGADQMTGTPILYDTAEQYFEKVSGNSPIVYSIQLVDIISDIKKWEADSVASYITRHYPDMSVSDSLKFGFYYHRTAAPSSERKFPADTAIYINYTGRRLDGVVFDTNIADTARYYGLYSSKRTYAPVKISWYGSDGKYSDIKMSASEGSTGTSVADGFAYALDQMHPHEQGTAIFYSGWGYGAVGPSNSIPSYSPLRFDFQIVDKP
ncbi:MAG: hypothetical protein K6E35_07085 [Bacteroidales bacterium]|nr:hypothetical protein [Bacteroidales bacterium]